MKKKILYLMINDWNWIFQRPQILSLMLEKDYSVTTIYPKISSDRMLCPDASKMPKKFKEYYLIPFRDKFRLPQQIQKFILRICTGNIEKYDIVWIGYPTLFRVIPQNYKGIIVYDCMDNYSEMYASGFFRKRGISFLQKQELSLLERADIVFASSNVLLEKLKCRGFKSPVILRNGFIPQNISSPQKSLIKKDYQLGYIGTIAEWFNIELLQKSLKHLHNIKYSLVGPTSIAPVHSDKIIYEGSIAHEKLFEKVKAYDALIMPFRINDIVLAVDPVKLYEYISFGKCIISIYYPEIERFRPFVYFYSNENEYIDLLKKLSKAGFPPKYDQISQQLFLSQNSWEVRYRIITQKIEEVYNEKIKSNECIRHAPGGN